MSRVIGQVELGEEQTVLQELDAEQTFLPCPGDDTIALLVDGELDAAERREIDRHVDRCHNCRRLLASLAREATTDATLTSASEGFVRRLEPGERLGHFVVSHLIGEGGMGAVYLARDAMLERDVALKVLATPLAGSRPAAERLLEEARATARLNHPNIVTIHAVGEDRDTPYLALEHVPGRRLRDWMMDSQGQLEAGLAYFTDVATALRAAHATGVVHRDLKPENVLLREDGVTKVVDFGLARGLGPASDATSSRVVAGTPRYMAPEQWRGEAQDAAVDVWALGVMLFEWVSGVHPFGAQRGPALDQSELRTRVLAGDRVPLVSAERIPSMLRETIEACLATQPALRPPIDQVRNALASPRFSLPIRLPTLGLVAMLVASAAAVWFVAGDEPALTTSRAPALSLPSAGRLSSSHTSSPTPDSAGSALPMTSASPPTTPTVVTSPRRRKPANLPTSSAPRSPVTNPAPRDLYREW